MKRNPLTPKVKPWVIQSFVTLIQWTEPLSVTILWKAVEKCVGVVLFGFQFFPGIILENFFNFRLGTVRVNSWIHRTLSRTSVGRSIFHDVVLT